MRLKILRWPAMALMMAFIACLGGSALAGNAPTTPSLLYEGPCHETACQIREAQAHLDELLLKYTDKHPDVIAARARLEELKLRQQREQAGLTCHPPIHGALLYSGVTEEQVVQAYRKALDEYEKCMKQPGAVEGEPRTVLVGAR